MKLILNLIWIIFGGLVMFLAWCLGGLLCTITIIGIPFGKQCFKIAKASLTPFGGSVTVKFSAHPIANVIWAILLGWELAIGAIISGILCCVTIVGIPLGKQWFKLAPLQLIPFGAKVK